MNTGSNALNRILSVLLIFTWVVTSCTAQVGNNDKDWVFPEDGEHGSGGWRSSLYPEDWQPGYTDNAGRFLHDFSYAGYHSGLRKIPVSSANFTDVTKPPFNADNDGQEDVTDIIQSAIDAVSQKGGGVVYLPAGTYKVSVRDDRQQALNVTSGNVVIRGAGPDKTFIKNTSVFMRSKSVIYFNGSSSWSTPQGPEVNLSEDVLTPTSVIPVENAAAFAAGDKVILKSDVTDAMREDFNVGEHWDNMNKGPHFCREIVAVDPIGNTVEIDVPTRYELLLRDNARMYKIRPLMTESGIENLSIGNIQHPSESGWGEEDYRTEGNGSYDVHASHAIKFRCAENCWVSNVHTYRPEENEDDIHLLSNCLVINDCRFITVLRCNFQKSQYEGGGGNGYMYTLGGNDCLISECHAEDGRHNYDFKTMSSNGNVIHACTSANPSLASDFHMHLSMANLFDCFIADKDHIDASFRPWGSAKARHMYTTTESVIWNTVGLSPDKSGALIVSKQYGNGYVIGTSGAVSKVETSPATGSLGGINYNTLPEDFVEGEGRGNTLVPSSLYLDQLEKRKSRIK